MLPTNGVRATRHLFLPFALAVAFLVFAPAAHAAPPANDNFVSAVALPTVPPETKGGTNVEATKQSGEPNHAGDPGGHSVWYSWTPSTSGPVGISTPACFGSFPALVAVYTGAAVNALTPVASNQGLPAPNCFGESAEVEFNASAGTTYWIAIDGQNGAQGFYEFTLKGAPENDDFADASVVAAEPPQILSGSTKFAGKETGEPDHAGDPGGHSTWYAWTPTTSGPISISTCSSFNSLDTLLAVYTGSSVNALTPIASNDDAPAPEWSPACSSGNSEVIFTASAGTTYRIAVDSSGGSVGRFNLRFRGRPANDDFGSPVVLDPVLPTNAPYSQTTQLATKQSGEPNHAGNSGGNSVWYSWTPSASGPVAISTCGSEASIDTLLAVYTGSAVNALTQVAANDDASGPSCGFEGSEVQFNAVAGTTYRLAVDGKDGAESRFTISLEGGPANDAFASAQSLGSSLPQGLSGSTRLATKQAGEPDHAGNPGGNSVWYSWTPSSSGPVVISVCPYTERVAPVLAVYTGSNVNTLTAVAGDDGSGSSCNPEASEAALTAVAGTTYRIAVDARGGGAGTFSLEIEGPPANDDFASPQVLPAIPIMAGGSNLFATKQAGEPDHAGDPGGHSLWYSWTPSSSGRVDITACGTNRELDTLLAVYTGSALNSLTPVAANDDAGGAPPYESCNDSRGGSEIELDVTAGTTYRIAVDGKGGGVGNFLLAFGLAPSNDDFSGAQPLSAGMPGYGNAMTKLATKQTGEPNHAGNAGGHSVWFTWTPSASATVAISACTYSGNLDPLLAVYTGSAVNALTQVVSGAPAGGSCHAGGSKAQFAAAVGTTYRIAVDGRDGSSGGAQVVLEGVAPNDDFARPQGLGGRPSAYTFGSNLFATKQASEPNHAGDPGGASVWFKWTAPHSGQVSVNTCGSDFDTLLAVYTGSAVNALTQVAANDDSAGKCSPRSKLSFAAVANTVYRIAVDGKDGAQGAFELSLSTHPRNDDFAAAEKISGTLGLYWSGSTLLATKQAGEPNHGGDPGGHSVWFSWTPVKSVAVEIDVCTGSFEPLLAVYAGSEIASLSPVAATDAGLGECEEGRSIGFDAVAGTTYRLVVDGAGGEEGSFDLHLRPAVAHPRSLSVASAGDGAGSVISPSAPIACDSACSYRLEVGELVTLDARPTPGSTFAGWSGGGCSGTAACQVTLNADTSVVANFTPVPSAVGGSSLPPAPTPPTPPSKPKPKPLKCKSGFKKTKVHGKAKCVKKKPKHRKHQR